jgi:peptide/nickel transport system permease protein
VSEVFEATKAREPVRTSGSAHEIASQPLLHPAPAHKEATFAQNTLSRLLRSSSAMVGAVVLLAIILAAIFAAQLSPYDPIVLDPRGILQAPRLSHLFGTDELGRDIFTRVVYGARISLWVGVVSVGISLSAGLALGLIAGYYSAWPDMLVMRLMDIMLAFPSIMLALGVVAILGPGIGNVMIAVGLSYIPHYTRVVRASVLATKVNPYIESARVAGARDSRIMFVHILPNAITPVIVISTLGLGVAILIAAGLSFLGLGVQPPTPEWGNMVSRGRTFMRLSWWVAAFPGLATMITVMAINLFGDGLRDALDPKYRRR